MCFIGCEELQLYSQLAIAVHVAVSPCMWQLAHAYMHAYIYIYIYIYIYTLYFTTSQLAIYRVNVHFTDTITRTSIYLPGCTANQTLNHTNTKCYRMFLNCQNYFLITLSSWVSERLLSRPPDSHFAQTGITPDTSREGEFIITSQLSSDAVDCRLHSYERLCLEKEGLSKSKRVI